MVAIPVFNAEGEKVREIDVDVDALDKAVRKPLLKEALIAYLASQRQGTHSTKTRSEVAGGGAKPWKQKGTGRARQGTIRAAQWVGGGRAHGPKPRDYSYRLPKKQRLLATKSSVRYRIEDGTCCAVEGLSQSVEGKPSTKGIAACLKGMGLQGRGALIVSEGHQPNLHLSARNIQKVEVIERRNLSAGPVLQRANLIFSVEALEALVKGDN